MSAANTQHITLPGCRGRGFPRALLPGTCFPSRHTQICFVRLLTRPCQVVNDRRFFGDIEPHSRCLLLPAWIW
eukprot:982604-Rhodomonas_salina.1